MRAGQRRHNRGPHTALAPTNHDKGEVVVMAQPYVLNVSAIAPATDLHMCQRDKFPKLLRSLAVEGGPARGAWGNDPAPALTT
jgi:hypothetical protein